MTTTEKTSTVVGLFDRHPDAEKAVRELVEAGVDRSDISLIARDAQRGTDVRDDDGRTTSGERSVDGTSVGENVAGGALFGGLGGLLIGLGALAIPGIGPVIAAGPLAATLAGTGLGALGGGVIGGLKKAGVPENDAEVYSRSIEHGGTLVAVQCQDVSVDRAVDILERNNAVDVDERANAYKTGAWPAAGATGSVPKVPATGATGSVPKLPYEAKTDLTDRETTIPVVQEELAVGKRTVDRGGIRVFKTVQERPVEEQVSLRDETVKVERRPVNRPADAGTLNTFEEGTIEVREYHEEAIVEKRARVVEEVVVGKASSERTETIKDTLRRTDVEVENLTGSGAVNSDLDTEFRTWHQTKYGNTNDYETYAPAYRYGYSSANDSRYSGRDWTAVEPDLRRDYERQYPGSTWDKIKDSVRHGWDRVTGRRA